jgi:hypothetical protein
MCQGYEVLAYKITVQLLFLVMLKVHQGFLVLVLAAVQALE